MKILTKVGRVCEKVVSKIPSGIRSNGNVIATVGGLAVMGAGTIILCKRIGKVKEIHQEYDESRAQLKQWHEDGRVVIPEEGVDEEYTKKAFAHDLTLEYGREALDITKTLALPIALKIVGAGAIVGSAIWSNKTIKELNGKLAVALIGYDSLSNYISKYRKNVIDDLGEEADVKYAAGLKEVVTEETITTKNGKEKVVQKTELVSDSKCRANEFSIPLRYTKVYDSALPRDIVIQEIIDIQNYANRIYHASGNAEGRGRKLGLSWVLNELGCMNWIPKGKEFVVMQNGWYGDDNNSHDYIRLDVFPDAVTGEDMLFINCWPGYLTRLAADDGYRLDIKDMVGSRRV